MHPRALCPSAGADLHAGCAPGSKAQQSAAQGAPAEAAARSAQQAAPSTTFFTKRVADPNLVPLLLSKGVQFGAVRVGPPRVCTRQGFNKTPEPCCCFGLSRMHCLGHVCGQHSLWPALQRGSSQVSGLQGCCCRTARLIGVRHVPASVGRRLTPPCVQATLSGAAARMLGTVIALWLPLVPIFLIMRHTLGSRSNLRCWPCLCIVC